MRSADSTLNRLIGLGVVALLAIHVLLAVFRIDEVGLTHDETAHLTAGYSYWKFGDYRLQPENGNLPQRWGALPLLLQDPQLQPDELPALWQRSDVWKIADLFLFDSGHSASLMLWQGRLTMTFWPIALGVLVFCWSRHLWGNGGALLSLGLFAFSPTLLAHGPLITSDTTAAFWLLAAVGAFWQGLQRGGRWLAVSLFATGCAFVAKFSCVLLVPMFLLLGLWHVLAGAPGLDRAARARRFGLLFGLNAGAAIAMIWLSFGFRYSAAAPALPALEQFHLTWEELLSRPGIVTDVIQFARHWQLLPEAYIEGFAHVRYQGVARGAFLLGEYSETGWWWFFPATFLWKSTSAELIATALLVTLALRRARRSRRSDAGALTSLAPLLVFALVFGGFSLASPLNIGHRHILSLYPVLFIAAGALVSWVKPAARPALLVLPLLSLGAAWSVAPHYLTFFNLPAGGPQQGWRKLVDSSLDWGQGLPSLKTWVEANRQPGEPLYVSYFGTDSLQTHLSDAIPLAPIFDHYRPREFVELTPGLYCIGATMMQDLFSPVKGPWDADKEDSYRRGMAWARASLAAGRVENRIIDFGREGTEQLWQVDRLRFARLLLYLRIRKPDAIVANTTLVFRLSELEIQAMIDGSPEIVGMFLQAAAAGEILGRDKPASP